MKGDGGCHCGNFTFEAEIDPDAVGIRHCTDCQRPSGTAFRVVVRTPEEKFTLLSGAPRTQAPGRVRLRPIRFSRRVRPSAVRCG